MRSCPLPLQGAEARARHRKDDTPAAELPPVGGNDGTPTLHCDVTSCGFHFCGLALCT